MHACVRACVCVSRNCSWVNILMCSLESEVIGNWKSTGSDWDIQKYMTLLKAHARFKTVIEFEGET